MKFILIILTLASLTGCYTGGKYVHPGMSTAQMQQKAFDCQYRAELMSQSYKGLYSAFAYADKYERCLQANGFVKQ